ncbi:MAG: HNH endonuclease [Myxococcota bacterium]
MRYWWVNQNQTYRHELRGGYLWSPKRKRDGSRNPFYEFMREVAPRDLIFSFVDTYIRAIGIARSHAYEAPKPEEFGSAGRNWEMIGWRIDVSFSELPRQIRPADWMSLLGPLLPAKYSPLRPNGHGSQTIYLTELPSPFALELARLLGDEVESIARSEVAYDDEVTAPRPDLILWEDHLRAEIEKDPVIPETEREALVLARRGQGRFREGVQRFEHYCRVTRVDRSEHLRASHCKPWRDSSNEERLDPENGLLLTPSIDHLFDRGYISFKSDGDLIISPVAHRESLSRMGVSVHQPFNAGRFTERQGRFLEFHRDEVFLKARIPGQ